MLNLLTLVQTRAADANTIRNRPVSSIDLMEKASAEFVKIFINSFVNRDLAISVYCGTGNNGGDGLAIARLLKEHGYNRISVKIARLNSSSTADFETNLKHLKLTGIEIFEVKDAFNFREEEADILVDALLGSGLSRPLDGYFKELVEHLNQLNKIIVSVDVPSGFPSEGLIDQQSTIIKADLVISFQRPKINFFFPESAPFINRFRFADIGLDEDFIQSQPGGWKLLEEQDIRELLQPRQNFSHKGTYGHALILAGSTQTMGAALLCADACLHSGAGLTTACIPGQGLAALNSRLPEVMALVRSEEDSELEIDFGKYQSIAAGPGLGITNKNAELVKHLLEKSQVFLVLDADALNILSENRLWMRLLPENTILTPHLKEFDRLFGGHQTWWDRVETGRRKAKEYGIIIILKNQYSFIILPGGDVLINPTGNPAMAVGGMGDVLTGMIAAFLAQGFNPQQASVLGCYLHGKAGDKLHEKSGMHCIPPRYLIKILPEIIGGYTSV